MRALRFITGQSRWTADPRGLDLVRIAFAFVAVHALTDPTNCGTASRALHLRPRPLHDDRALLRRVLSDARSVLDPAIADVLPLYISMASAFFADPDVLRWSRLFGAHAHDAGMTSSLLAYNPDALREACRAIGLDVTSLHIAPRR